MTNEAKKMVTNFTETLVNLGNCHADLSPKDVEEIGKALYRDFAVNGQDDSAMETLDSARIILQLAAGIPTCFACGDSAFHGCKCGVDGEIIDPL